jgi:hypothetical protein
VVCVRTHVRVCSVCVVRMHVRVCVHVCMAVGHGACGAWGVGKRQVGMARVGKRQVASGKWAWEHGGGLGVLVHCHMHCQIASFLSAAANSERGGERRRGAGAC